MKRITLLALAGFGLAALFFALGHPPEITGGIGLISAMAVVQSSYSENIPVGYAGQIINEVDADVDTRIAEVGTIAFGLALGRGTNDNGVVLGSTAATDFLGVSVRDVTLLNSSTPDVYPLAGNVAVMTKGDMLVAVAAAVVDGDNVTYNKTTGALSSISADGSNFAITGARWMTTQATPGSLARLRLTGDLPSA